MPGGPLPPDLSFPPPAELVLCRLDMSSTSSIKWEQEDRGDVFPTFTPFSASNSIVSERIFFLFSMFSFASCSKAKFNFLNSWLSAPISLFFMFIMLLKLCCIRIFSCSLSAIILFANVTSFPSVSEASSSQTWHTELIRRESLSLGPV